MKKFLMIALFSSITLFYSSRQGNFTVAQAVEKFGENYTVTELNKSYFLLTWEEIGLVYKNNKVVCVVK